MLNRDAPDGGDIPARLRTFGRSVAVESPLYGRISTELAEDEALGEIIALAPHDQPAANILLAAVQYLLLQGADPALAAHYPTLSSTEVTPTGDPVGLFAGFCRRERERLQTIVATRTVQTNEVRRCTALMPAFAWVARKTTAPLALIEIGPSAGLNLVFDRYRYDYGEGLTAGPPSSLLQLDTEVRSITRPGVDPFPEVAWRRGIDLHPIDVSNPDEVLWARSLLWPEQFDRLARFEQAVELARPDPPVLIKGNALDLLPEIAASAPDDATLVIFHSFVLNQFSPEARQRLAEQIVEIGSRRPVHRVGMDMMTKDRQPAEILHTRFSDGDATGSTLGRADHHGSWLEWIA
jgi:hypothetical protein